MRHKHSIFFAKALLLAALSTSALAQFRNIEWVELLPDADREALLGAPPLDHAGGDTGPPPAPRLRSTNDPFAGDAFSEAMLSANVRPELDGESVRLPGFVVPIEYDANQNVTEFFLVPYFGACIHMPPPPPNQIIYVAFPEGFELPSIYEPYTVEGQLTTSMTSNDLALSAYRIDAVTVEIYRE